MNETKQKYNELTFLRSEGDVFILHAQDKYSNTCRYKMIQFSQ
jgi:hypothetical protein